MQIFHLSKCYKDHQELKVSHSTINVIFSVFLFISTMATDPVEETFQDAEVNGDVSVKENERKEKERQVKR